MNTLYITHRCALTGRVILSEIVYPAKKVNYLLEAGLALVFGAAVAATYIAVVVLTGGSL